MSERIYHVCTPVRSVDAAVHVPVPPVQRAVTDAEDLRRLLHLQLLETHGLHHLGHDTGVNIQVKTSHQYGC